jgi:histidine triad (HIT) family protein
MSARRTADPECLFCRIAAGEIPSDRVHEDEELVAFRDIAPRAPVHILLIPREHITSAAELTAADGPLLGRLFELAAELARREGVAESGFRIVANAGPGAGQSVAHLHFHLLGGRTFSWPPG